MKEDGVAETLLRERLPPSLVKRFAGPPQQSSESFVDEAMRGSLADVVLRVPLLGGKAAHVYCLVEHKRTADAYVLVQVLRYLTALYAQFAKTARGRLLPAVFPLVIYNGHARWRGPRRFAEGVDVPASLRRWVVDFEVILVNVGAEPIVSLSAHPTLRGGLLGLKAAATPVEKLPRVLREMVRSLRHDESTRSLFFDYLMKVGGREVLPSIQRAREEVEGEEDEMQTAAQYLDHVGYNRGMRHGLKRGLQKGIQRGIEKGIQKGLQKGIEKGLQEGIEKGQHEAAELLRSLLRRGLAKRFKRVPKVMESRIEEADAVQLATWLSALDDAKSMKTLLAARSR